MQAEIEVVKTGLSTTIQDRGRIGFAKYGVPKSGPMDLKSHDLANALLGNGGDDAVLEWTLLPPVLKFSKATYISCTGAEIIPILNNEIIALNHIIYVPENSILKFKIVTCGVYGYIAIKGGIQTPIVMGSRSWYHPITKASVLSSGVKILYDNYEARISQHASLHVDGVHSYEKSIRVYTGPEYDQLSEENRKMLHGLEFTIGNVRSRMGIQLEELFSNHLKPILTSPVLPGTVQLTPSGKLVVLMRDCQTTGGYPRILQLSEAAISILAQRQTGAKVVFKLI